MYACVGVGVDKTGVNNMYVTVCVYLLSIIYYIYLYLEAIGCNQIDYWVTTHSDHNTIFE